MTAQPSRIQTAWARFSETWDDAPEDLISDPKPEGWIDLPRIPVNPIWAEELKMAMFVIHNPELVTYHQVEETIIPTFNFQGKVEGPAAIQRNREPPETWTTTVWIPEINEDAKLPVPVPAPAQNSRQPARQPPQLGQLPRQAIWSIGQQVGHANHERLQSEAKPKPDISRAKPAVSNAKSVTQKPKPILKKATKRPATHLSPVLEEFDVRPRNQPSNKRRKLSQSRTNAGRSTATEQSVNVAVNAPEDDLLMSSLASLSNYGSGRLLDKHLKEVAAAAALASRPQPPQPNPRKASTISRKRLRSEESDDTDLPATGSYGAKRPFKRPTPNPMPHTVAQKNSSRSLEMARKGKSHAGDRRNNPIDLSDSGDETESGHMSDDYAHRDTMSDSEDDADDSDFMEIGGGSRKPATNKRKQPSSTRHPASKKRPTSGKTYSAAHKRLGAGPDTPYKSPYSSDELMPSIESDEPSAAPSQKRFRTSQAPSAPSSKSRKMPYTSANPAPNPKPKAQPWTDDQLQKVEMILRAIKDEEKEQGIADTDLVKKDTVLWDEVSRQLSAQGVEKTTQACRSYWSRVGRAQTGFDERYKKNPDMMATCIQKTK